MSKFLWVSGETPDNVLEGIRTPDPRLRRPLLYPTELQTQRAGDGNRTHVSSLEGWCSTIELHPHINLMKFKISVGVTGFEPATSWSQTRRSSQAEPHPVICLYAFLFFLFDTRYILQLLFLSVKYFFTFFNIFLLSFYFPALFPAHCLQRVVSYHRFSLLSTPFFKKV